MDKLIVACIKSLEGHICTFNDCPMFSNCFPDSKCANCGKIIEGKPIHPKDRWALWDFCSWDCVLEFDKKAMG